MDLELSAAQRALQAEATAWLAEHTPQSPLPPIHTIEGLEAHRHWERTLHGAGWSAVHWPVEYGGRGADVISSVLFQEAYVRAGAPERLQPAGLSLFGPIVIELGTPAQRAAWLPTILTCERIWCQGFSEPGAGSDLAGLRTRGVVEQDRIVVTGQKIWVTRGPVADRMFALVRTDQEQSRHRGLSFVTIDLNAPGVDVRPIRHIDGHPEFAEVFLDEVSVPLTDVVGEVGDGWRVAMSTLTHERGGGGQHTPAHIERAMSELVELARATGASDDPVVAHELAALQERTVAYRWLATRTLSEASSGHRTGAQAAMGKLWWSELEADIRDLGLRVAGAESLLEIDGMLHDHWLHENWRARAALVFAGTSEIQRTIIGERVLGLPKEPRHAV